VGSAAEFLIEELRAARTARGLSQEDLGKLINYSGSHVSAVETGQRPPKLEYVAAVDEALQTGGLFSRMLNKLASLDSAPPWLREWIVIEREATTLRWFELAFVPGLLQTEAYARATLRAGGMLTSDQVEQRVTSRLERQAILTGERPPQFIAVLDEAVLRRTVDGDRDLMAEQLERLVSCAEQPYVQILVVPADVGIYPGLQGAFILASLADGTVAAHLDQQIKAQVANQFADIATLQQTWEAIRGEALPRRQSLDLIKEVAKTWT